MALLFFVVCCLHFLKQTTHYEKHVPRSRPPGHRHRKPHYRYAQAQARHFAAHAAWSLRNGLVRLVCFLQHFSKRTLHMHYLFERRLNMLEIAVHELSDEALADFGQPDTLLKDYSIYIPELNAEKVKEGFHKKDILPDEGPEGFRIRHKEKAYYYTYEVPFTHSEFLTDILPMRSCEEGLSISADHLRYTEYSHTPIDGDAHEKQRLRANAEKAIADVTLVLDEWAANAVEFNQLVLPVAIQEKIQAERLLRFEREERRRQGLPAYA